ncbi:MAG: hypothetical protein WCI02_00585 [Planctomycetota bacterium]
MHRNCDSKHRSKGNRLARARWKNPGITSCMGVFLLLATVIGCGGGEKRVQTFKSSGKVVKSDGSPVPHALVVLHPIGGSTEAPKSRGTTDEQGIFQLSTYDTSDGAPVGQFSVTIEQWIRDDPNKPPKNHLPPALSRAETSGFQVSITSGVNQINPFEIR